MNTLLDLYLDFVLKAEYCYIMSTRALGGELSADFVKFLDSLLLILLQNQECSPDHGQI